MRLVTYRRSAAVTWGLLSSGLVSDARSMAGAPTDTLDLLESNERDRWLAGLAAPGVGVWHEQGSVQLMAPLPRPARDLIALGLNYVQHVDESTASTKQTLPPRQPILFGKAASSVVGPDAEVRVVRSLTSQVDWEVELAVVIGKAGRDIPRGGALGHVFGYTVANDVSARDLQFLDGGQWYRGKSLDTFCPLGPWIVGRDELGDARGLRIEFRVNGRLKQSASTSDLLFDIPTIIESASAGRTLYAGDVILTGTPGGVGLGRTPPEYLRDGDVMEAEIEGIGILRNTVREVAQHYDVRT